jgi:hypothetical protein
MALKQKILASSIQSIQSIQSMQSMQSIVSSSFRASRFVQLQVGSPQLP